MQKSKGFSKFSGNILQEDESVLREAGNKLKEEERDLKILGEGMIFVETIRKNGESIFNFGLQIADCGRENH